MIIDQPKRSFHSSLVSQYENYKKYTIGTTINISKLALRTQCFPSHLIEVPSRPTNLVNILTYGKYRKEVETTLSKLRNFLIIEKKSFISEKTSFGEYLFSYK